MHELGSAGMLRFAATVFAVILLSVSSIACSKETVIHLGTKYASAEDLGVQPTKDSSSKSGFLVPTDVKQAASELEKMLPGDLLQKVRRENGMESDFLTRNGKLLDLGAWLFKNWSLDQSDSMLGRELSAKGFDNQEWMARALYEAVFEKQSSATTAEFLRLQRFAFSVKQDAMSPVSPPPPECAGTHGNVQSKDIWLGESNRWPYSRIIRWVECDDKTKRAYLWEREWFVPDPNLLLMLDKNYVM